MKVVIMAGGKGTRLSSVLKDAPKPMVSINGKPLLEHIVESLHNQEFDDIVMIVGHLSEVIKNHFEDGKRFGVKISYYTETEPLGTAGGLYEIRKTLGENFLLLFGDVYQKVDYNRFVEYHLKKKSELTLMVHPNSHPYDSDIVLCDKDKRVKGWLGKKEPRPYHYPNNTNAGAYVVKSSILEILPHGGVWDFEKDVVLSSYKNHLCYAYFSTEYVKDIGTPDRLKAVENDIANGICKQKMLVNKQKCIFLDRDGTINKAKGFITDMKEIELENGVAEAIKMINKSPYLAIVVTNQPVIARGESTFEEVDAINERLQTLLGENGVYIDGIYYCPHHPDSGFKGEVKELKIKCSCRKPEPGMLMTASKDYNIDLSKSWMVGDMTSDILAGKNAGVKTALLRTGEGGKDGKYDVKADLEFDDLLSCVKEILND